MAGWDLKYGPIKEFYINDDRIWSLFNYVFSDSCRKRNTYKYGLIKSLLDSLFSGKKTGMGIFYTYEELFARFTENYWNLVIKYDLRQMRPDGNSRLSKIETILKRAATSNGILSTLEFSAIDKIERNKIVQLVTADCKKYVVGALYADFDGYIYAFDLNAEGLTLSYCFYEFMLKYKAELERLNYYSWAKFLEKVNQDNLVVRVIDKLELATPRRSDLSIYREILRKEFEDNTCFYCGRKLKDNAHVDHFIPWSFVKDDKLWNFVLSCPTCNERKNNRVPSQKYLLQINDRNKILQKSHDIVVLSDFESYTDGLLDSMWEYAKRSGIKEFNW